MSQFSTTHAIMNNAEGKIVAYTGQRLSSCWWKQTAEMKEKGIEARKPIAASIPVITSAMIDANLVALTPHIVSMLESVQDKIIRARAESGYTDVNDSDISVAACIEMLEVENKGGRLTKESINTWFDAEILELLQVSLADKLGISDTPTPAETQKLEQLCNVVKDKISSLAGSKTTFPVDHAQKLVGILRLAPEDDAMSKKLIARLEGMKRVEEDIFATL